MNVRSSRITTKADIDAEAAAWFIEFRAGDIASDSRARFDEWLRRSPEHIQAYLEIAAGWAELPTSDPEARIDISALIERARGSGEENIVTLRRGSSVLSKRHRPGPAAWSAGLASLALVVCVAIWAYLYQANLYATGVGEQRTVRLVDGSIIELNALSKIRVRLSKNTREIDLVQGEALFHVAKDRARPFIVRTNGTTVRAVGTQFDVYRKTHGTVVTVLEGRVAVAMPDRVTSGRDQAEPPASPVLMVAGEQLVVSSEPSQKTQSKPRHTDVTVATGWVQKRLIFEDTPLGDVAEEFNRYNTRRLVIAPELRSVAISGVYALTDPDSLLGFLRAQPNIQFNETDDEIRASPRGNK